MSWLDIFDWLELTTTGTVIRDSMWLFPVIESVHLLGLAVLGGAVLMVDIRALGWGVTSRTTGQVVAETNPWLGAGIVVMLLTGIPLFLSEAVKCYYSEAFWVKMSALAVALVYTFAVRNPSLRRDPPLNRWLMKLLGVLSIGVWMMVAAAGRWIGFS